MDVSYLPRKHANILCISREEAPAHATYSAEKATSIEALGHRASSRGHLEPVLAVISPIDPATKDGSDGMAAPDAPNGYAGQAGHSRSGAGGCGGCGGDGGTGTVGGTGGSGADNRDVRVDLHRQADGTAVVWRSDLPRNDTVIPLLSNGFVLIDTKGGQGGRGGRGGRGGDGGRGGNGGEGARGARGSDGSNGTFNDGQDGDPGYPGGDGGAGGNAGDGGDGGRGGDSGVSGNIIVTAPENDSALLWLVETDARIVRGGVGGEGGPSGVPGLGGAGGKGGRGGSGGRGYNVKRSNGSTDYGRNGSRGPDGPDGRRGKTGSQGVAGRKGANGNDGHAGNVTYALTRDGHTVLSLRDRFEMAVNGYTVLDEDDDGVFSPGAAAFVTDIDVANIGEMALPVGAVVDVFAERPATYDAYTTALPSMDANTTHKVTDRWTVHIPVSGPPTTAPYTSSVQITSRVALLGRPFSQSLVTCKALPVMYPVRITDMRCTQWLGPNEMSTIEVDVHNISRKVYGGTHLLQDGGDSLGKVQVRFVVDELLTIIPGKPLNTTQLSCVEYVIEDGLRTAVCTLPPIPPHTKMTVGFTFAVVPEAGNRLFAQMPYRVDLLLNSRAIEYRSEDIRVTPVFVPNMCTDVVLVTSSEMERNEFLAWSYLLQCLHLSVNFWDIERYDGMATPDLSWVGTCRTLIVPCPVLPQGRDMKATPADFLRFSDVYTHLSTPYAGDAQYNATAPQTGLLLLGDASPTRFLFDLLQPVLGNLSSVNTPVTFRKFGPESMHEIPKQLPAPPTLSKCDFSVPATIPRFAVLPAPMLPEGVYSMRAPDSELKLGGCGSCCDFSECCECCECTTSNGEMLMRRFQRQLVEADPSRQFLIAHGQGTQRGKDLGIVNCCSSETVPIAVYPALFPRTTPVIMMNANPFLTHANAWIPFDCDGAVFQAKHEPWQDNTFTQVLRSLLHLLPVEKRVELLFNTFLSSLTFSRAPDNAQCNIGFIVAMSLARAVSIEQKVNKELFVCVRIAKAVTTDLGDRSKYILFALLGPHVTNSSIKDIGLNAAKKLGMSASQACTLTASVVADIVARDGEEGLLRYLQFTPWGNGISTPCDDDNYTLLKQTAPEGKFPFITSNALQTVEHQALSWVYSIADQQYRQNKLAAGSNPALAYAYDTASGNDCVGASGASGEGGNDYYKNMEGYGTYAPVFTTEGALSVPHPTEFAPEPAPPPSYFTVSGGTAFAAPVSYDDEARQAAYEAEQRLYATPTAPCLTVEAYTEDRPLHGVANDGPTADEVNDEVPPDYEENTLPSTYTGTNNQATEPTA